MYEIDIASMRHRTKEMKSTVGNYTIIDSEHPVGQAPNPTPFTRRIQTYRKNVSMWDVVTKDFHKRQAKGEIFNSPMRSESSECKTPVSSMSGSIIYYGPNKEPRTKRTLQQTFLAISEPEIDVLRSLSSNEERLRNVALTAAYAGVTANEQNAVLWAGEARETVKMVTDIGSSLMTLWKKTQKQRAAWAKGKLTVPEAQNLTLSILYGILPLEQSIAQVMKGLFALKADGSRQTSRGFQIGTSQRSDSYKIEYPGKNFLECHYNESNEILVRAGVLYEIDIDDYPSIAIIADPKQIAETAYALARLSFVIDWFLNVGNTIMSWAPSLGTKELAAWVTVEETNVIAGNYSYWIESIPDETSVSGINASTTFSKTVTTKTRYPVSRGDLALIPRLNINLNISKLSSLVLLFAKVKQK